MKANAATVGSDTSSYTFEKVTSVDAFSDGGQFIFVAGNVDVEKIGSNLNYMGESTSSYFSRVTSLEDALLLDIEMQSDGNYSISVGNGKYLSYDVGSKNSATSSDVINDSSLWNFKYENDTWTIKNVSETSRIFQYNAGSPRFACYTSSQTKISIFEFSSIDTYNVTFYDGNNVIHTEQVNSGDLIDFSSINVEKDGYVFEGWYEDPKFTIAYDEDAPVTENLNLYAHYIAYEDLTSGEIFASETTKTSLIANANIAFESISEDINFSSGDLGLLFENTKITSTGGTDPRVDDDHIRLYADNTIKFSSSYIIESVDYVAIHSSDYRDLSNAATELSDGVTINSTGDYQGTIMVKNNSFSFKISKGTQVRLSSLTIHYSNIPSVSVNSASIRFGTTLDSKLYDKSAKYGVVFGLNGEDLNTLSEGMTKISELGLPYQEVDHVAKVDEIGALEESETPETAQYFQYAIVVNDMLAHIDEEITAACYMQTADGLYVMNEVTYSLRSLAQKYIDDHVADESIDVLNAIVNYQA